MVRQAYVHKVSHCQGHIFTNVNKQIGILIRALILESDLKVEAEQTETSDTSYI